MVLNDNNDNIAKITIMKIIMPRWTRPRMGTMKTEMESSIHGMYGPHDIRPTSCVVRRSESGVSCGSFGSSFLHIFNDPDEITRALGSMNMIEVGIAPFGVTKEQFCMQYLNAFKTRLHEVYQKGECSFMPEAMRELQQAFEALQEKVWFTTAPDISYMEFEVLGTLADYLSNPDTSHTLQGVLMARCSEKDFRNSRHGIVDPSAILSRLDASKEFFELPDDADLVAQAINLYNQGLGEFPFSSHDAFTCKTNENHE